MYLPFETMPGHSRVWVYQANRKFSPGEQQLLSAGLQALCEQWSTHGAPLHTSFSIQHEQFVIMAVDEQHLGASGCSIDGSVHYLIGLQEKLGIDFFDRTRVAFLLNGVVVQHHLAELKTLFQNQILFGDTHAFNNVVGTKSDWEKHWQVEVRNSWLARYLPPSAVVS
jgi:hypothetical protein